MALNIFGNSTDSASNTTENHFSDDRNYIYDQAESNGSMLAINEWGGFRTGDNATGDFTVNVTDGGAVASSMLLLEGIADNLTRASTDQMLAAFDYSAAITEDNNATWTDIQRSANILAGESLDLADSALQSSLWAMSDTVANAFSFSGKAQNSANWLVNDAMQSMIKSTDTMAWYQSSALDTAARAGELAMGYVADANNPGSDSNEQVKYLVIAMAAVAAVALWRR